MRRSAGRFNSSNRRTNFASREGVRVGHDVHDERSGRARPAETRGREPGRRAVRAPHPSGTKFLFPETVGDERNLSVGVLLNWPSLALKK
jgi:hypothetical protein